MISNFSIVTQKYIESLDQIGFSVDELRAEIHVESLMDWSLTGDLAALKHWFLNQQKLCKMSIENISLEECRGWSFGSDGWIHHESGDFFIVQGVRVSLSHNREVQGGWDQPIVRQVGYDGGLLGLLRKRIDGVPHYLVEAKAEPGNPDKVQISPTLQATFSNLKQAHGGRKPRFSEFFEAPSDNGGKVLFSQWMSEDGGRLHLKRNRGMLVEVPEGASIEMQEGFRWVSMFQLKRLIKENSWVNPHIRSIIAPL